MLALQVTAFLGADLNVFEPATNTPSIACNQGGDCTQLLTTPPSLAPRQPLGPSIVVGSQTLPPVTPATVPPTQLTTASPTLSGALCSAAEIGAYLISGSGSELASSCLACVRACDQLKSWIPTACLSDCAGGAPIVRTSAPAVAPTSQDISITLETSLADFQLDSQSLFRTELAFAYDFSVDRSVILGAVSASVRVMLRILPASGAEVSAIEVGERIVADIQDGFTNRLKSFVCLYAELAPRTASPTLRTAAPLSRTPSAEPSGAGCDLPKLAACGNTSTICVCRDDCCVACLTPAASCTEQCKAALCACTETYRRCTRAIDCYTDSVKANIDSLLQQYRGIDSCQPSPSAGERTVSPVLPTPIPPLSPADLRGPSAVLAVVAAVILLLWHEW